jgi:hypothetical protein
VPEFLSEEWIAALDAVARDSPALARLGEAGPFTVVHVVRDVPDPAPGRAARTVVMALECRDGHVRVEARPEAGPLPARGALRVECDYDTAVGLARGTTNVQHALAVGAWRASGDLAAVAARAGTLHAVGDVFAAVRAATTYRDRAP